MRIALYQWIRSSLLEKELHRNPSSSWWILIYPKEKQLLLLTCPAWEWQDTCQRNQADDSEGARRCERDGAFAGDRAGWGEWSGGGGEPRASGRSRQRAFFFFLGIFPAYEIEASPVDHHHHHHIKWFLDFLFLPRILKVAKFWLRQ